MQAVFEGTWPTGDLTERRAHCWPAACQGLQPRHGVPVGATTDEDRAEAIQQYGTQRAAPWGKHLWHPPVPVRRAPLQQLAVVLVLGRRAGARRIWCPPSYFCWSTSSTAQGGGGSFKNRKPIGEVGCCESGMAERIHWWTERCLRSPLFLSLSLTIYLPTHLSSMYLSIYRSISLSLSSNFLSIYPSIYLSLSLICLSV